MKLWSGIYKNIWSITYKTNRKNCWITDKMVWYRGKETHCFINQSKEIFKKLTSLILTTSVFQNLGSYLIKILNPRNFRLTSSHWLQHPCLHMLQTIKSFVKKEEDFEINSKCWGKTVLWTMSCSFQSPFISLPTSLIHIYHGFICLKKYWL